VRAPRCGHHWTVLRHLARSLSSLYSNQLNGTIPSSLGSLTGLNNLCVHHAARLARNSLQAACTDDPPIFLLSYLQNSGLCGTIPTGLMQPNDGALPACPTTGPVSFATFVGGWRWTGGGASSLGIDAVMGTGAYGYDTSSWYNITTGVGNDPVVPSNMSSGVSAGLCCSWYGSTNNYRCNKADPAWFNCQSCRWYVRSPGLYFSAGSYTISGSVDDSVVWRLVPQSGAQYINVGGFGTFTVSTAGKYVIGGQLNNGQYCASITISSFSPISGVYANSPTSIIV